MPQTAPAAEWTAWTAVLQQMSQPTVIFTDCRAVQVQAEPRGRREAMAKAARASTWLKTVCPHHTDDNCEEDESGPKPAERPHLTLKTKAHVRTEALPSMSPFERWQAAANDREGAEVEKDRLDDLLDGWGAY